MWFSLLERLIQSVYVQQHFVCEHVRRRRKSISIESCNESRAHIVAKLLFTFIASSSSWQRYCYNKILFFICKKEKKMVFIISTFIHYYCLCHWKLAFRFFLSDTFLQKRIVGVNSHLKWFTGIPSVVFPIFINFEQNFHFSTF